MTTRNIIGKILASTTQQNGDHLVDPSAVPGILFTNFPLPQDINHIRELPVLMHQTLRELGN